MGACIRMIQLFLPGTSSMSPDVTASPTKFLPQKSWSPAALSVPARCRCQLTERNSASGKAGNTHSRRCCHAAGRGSDAIWLTSTLLPSLFSRPTSCRRLGIALSQPVQNSDELVRGRTFLTEILPVQRWIEEMSGYLKQTDPNHMVTVGEEGFYGPGSAAEAANPGTGWATITGQNFSANHAPDSIDFAAIHLWPDNWEVGCL